MPRRLLLLLLVAVACARSAARDEFVLRIAVVGPFAPSHPLAESTNTVAAQDLVFAGLLEPDEHGTLGSRVLRDWQRVDQRRYRIRLRPDLRFSDGSPVLAEDVIASLTARKLEGAISGEWIEVSSSGTGPPIESALLFTMVFKRTPNGFIGTGPFRLVEQTETRIALERVKPERGRINRVELLAFPTLKEVLKGALGGRANAALNLDERQLVLFSELRNLKTVRGVSPHALAIVFNPARLNAAARSQLRAALPVESIAAALRGGTWNERKGLEERRELAPGKPLELMVPRISGGLDRAALAAARALGKRRGDITHVDMLEAEAREKSGDFDIAIRPALVWPEAAVALSWSSEGLFNYAHYSNPRVDGAFAQGDFVGAKAELEADAAFVEIGRRERFGVVDARIKNPRLGWWGILDTLPDWEIEE